MDFPKELTIIIKQAEKEKKLSPCSACEFFTKKQIDGIGQNENIICWNCVHADEVEDNFNSKSDKK